MTPQADALIRSHFPNLQDDEYEVTSPQTREYNCIAWAAEDTENWWWPSVDDHWPDGVPRVNTVDNFILAFQLTFKNPHYLQVKSFLINKAALP